MPVRRRRTRGRGRRQRRQTQRGGRFSPLRAGAIVWPERGGCDKGKSLPNFIFYRGEIFDRFGPPSGTYISPVGDAADRLAGLLEEDTAEMSNTQPNVYTYASRALPYAGVTDAGVADNSLRRSIYEKVYSDDFKKYAANPALQPGQDRGINGLDYHKYRVLQEGVVGMACRAAPAFNTPGGALQVNLKEPISKYIADNLIEELLVKDLPPYSEGGSPITLAFKA
jgi:hypothetical protein